MNKVVGKLNSKGRVSQSSNQLHRGAKFADIANIVSGGDWLIVYGNLR